MPQEDGVLDREGEAEEADLDDVGAAEQEAQEGEESPNGADDAVQADGADDATDGVVVTIGEELPPPEEDERRAPEWVREMRKNNRQMVRQLREQDAEIARLKGTSAAPSAVVVGPEPEIEEFADADAIAKYRTDLTAWHERKRKADEQQRQQADADTNARAAWQARMDIYNRSKADLKVQDFEDAEAVVLDILSVTQQGVIVHGADNSAILTYALGKNPKKAKELASIADPVKFAFAVAKLETQLKVAPRKTAPLPEKIVRGSAPGAAAVDNQLQRLRDDAAKTGDLSKVMAYKNAHKKRA